MVGVQSNGEIIAEVAEQLSWLAAALRTPEPQQGLSYQAPIIRSDHEEEHELTTHPNRTSSIHAHHKELEDQVSKASLLAGDTHPILDEFIRKPYYFRISFDSQPISAPPQSLGFGFEHMFNNLVIVRGYPILRQPCQTLGSAVAQVIDSALRLTLPGTTQNLHAESSGNTINQAGNTYGTTIISGGTVQLGNIYYIDQSQRVEHSVKKGHCIHGGFSERNIQ